MLKSEVEIGGVYSVRWHDGRMTEVEILREKAKAIYAGYSVRQIGTKTRWVARNLATGRVVEIKSAAKLQRRVR